MTRPRLDAHLGAAYARALVTVARADGPLVLDEILRIRAIVARRVDATLDEATLFGEDLDVVDLVMAARGAHPDPFRSTSPAPRELGFLLIEDGLSLALADGHVAPEEIAVLAELARALGCTDEDLGALAARLPAWLALPR